MRRPKAHIDLDKLYARDKARCHLCGRHVPREEATRDHLVPASAGGKNGKLNVKLAHQRCNAERGNKPLPADARKVTGRMRRL